MTGEEIVIDYPLAAEKIKECLYKQIEKSCIDNKIENGFKNYMLEDNTITGRLIQVVDDSPRLLFDAFDSVDIFCEITCSIVSFGAKVYSKKQLSPYISGVKTRIEADRLAIETAFGILENNLTNPA